MASKRIGWLGLGLIGLPMAARLVAAGWHIKGFDPKPERLALARDRGITAASQPQDALAAAPLVFTSLPSESALLDVAASIPGGVTWVETSTVGPQASAKAAQTISGRGVAYLRAPISGSTNLAEAGTLTTLVSGPRSAFDAAREALAAYSRAQIYLGEAEEARYAKLSLNLMVAVTAGMMAEALALARKGGIGWEAMLELLGESVVASPLVKYKLEPLRRRDFTPAATSSLLVKDVELMVEAARQAGVPVPLAKHMLEVYRGMMDTPLAGEDFISVVKVTERAAGLGDPPVLSG
jgi:3-hydroxyisobutyrate dehydrogenase-like beta-hydroxyacid dehydrogenase